MTTAADAKRVLDYVRKFSNDVQERQGRGESWDYTFPDGITEHYTVTGIMSEADLRRNVESAFVWLWNTKDYLKKLAEGMKKDPQSIENLVNQTPALSIIADVGNALKHGGLDRKPRSGSRPRMGVPRFSYPQAAIASLVFAPGRHQTLNVSDPKLVEIDYPVLDEQGRVLADAIVLLESGLKYFEDALSKL